jgi:hypothetical protein
MLVVPRAAGPIESHAQPRQTLFGLFGVRTGELQVATQFGELFRDESEVEMSLVEARENLT